MTREVPQRSTEGPDVLSLATSLAGLHTSEDGPVDKKVLRGPFGPEKANTPEPVLDEEEGEEAGNGLALGEGILDEPEGDEQGPPKAECIVFVGDLARAMSDSDLERAFSSVGTVVMVDIKRDKLTGRNLGYGFVQMATREEAEAAKERLHGAEVQGRRIRVGWAQRNSALFVGDLDETITVEALAEAFGRFGQLLHEHTYVRSGRFGWYGGLRFQSRADAEMARREMNGVRLGAYPIRVAWHHTQPGGPNVHHGAFTGSGGGGGGGGGGGPPRPYSVHVQFEADASQTAVSESLIHCIFAPFGEVTAVVLPQGRGVLSHDNDGSGGGGGGGPSCRGYGFVHFAGTQLGRRCALEAIRALNGQVVHGVRLSTCFSKKPTGGPRPSSAPPGRMGRLPRRMMMMDHHAGGVGDVAMGFRPIAMSSPTGGGGGGMGFGGGYPGMEGGMPGVGGGVGDGRGGGPWPMQPYPGAGNAGDPGMMHGPPQPYAPGGPYGHAPYPPYGGYPPQMPLQPQPQYYSAQGYGGGGGGGYHGHSPYPLYHQGMSPSGGPADGPMPPMPPLYAMQQSNNSGGGGSGGLGGGGGGGAGGEEMGDGQSREGLMGYGEYHGGFHFMGPCGGGGGGPLPPMSTMGGHGEGLPDGL